MTDKATTQIVEDAAMAFEEEQSHPPDGGSWFSSEPEPEPLAKGGKAKKGDDPDE